MHFDGDLARLLEGDDGLGELRPLLGGADVAVVNLETSITDRGSPEPKTFHFRTSPKALSTLAKAGVDVVSMANNHAVDYGPVGLQDTLAAKAASPVPIVGVGRDAAEAFAPAVLQAKGLSVAVIGSTQVNDLTVNKFPATDRHGRGRGQLQQQRPAPWPPSRTQSSATTSSSCSCTGAPTTRTVPTGVSWPPRRRWRQRGPTSSSGGHAHRVQGSGWLGHAYVGYGLGNFVWNNRRGEAEKRSGVLTVSVDVAAAQAAGDEAGPSQQHVVSGVTYTPLQMSDADGIPRPPKDPTALRQAWENARTCARLRPTP